VKKCNFATRSNSVGLDYGSNYVRELKTVLFEKYCFLSKPEGRFDYSPPRRKFRDIETMVVYTNPIPITLHSQADAENARPAYYDQMAFNAATTAIPLFSGRSDADIRCS
jgi:hypothetical protein